MQVKALDQVKSLKLFPPRLRAVSRCERGREGGGGRERERECVCVRERECVYVCVWERESEKERA